MEISQGHRDQWWPPAIVPRGSALNPTQWRHQMSASCSYGCLRPAPLSCWKVTELYFPQPSVLASPPNPRISLLHQWGPKGRVPHGKPLWATSLVLHLGRVTRSSPPWCTRLAAHPSKVMWGLHHELFSNTARSTSHTEVPTHSACPNRRQLEKIPAAPCRRAVSWAQAQDRRWLCRGF